MTAGKFGARPSKVTPESLMYDAIERIGRNRDGRLVVHIHLSRLLPHNSEDSKIRIAFRMFEGMADSVRGQLFLLSNNDIVFVSKDARLADVDAMVYRLRALFSKDPLTYAETGNGFDRFATYYELEYQFDVFFALCAQFRDEAKKRQKEGNPNRLSSIDAGNLTRVMEGLAVNDIAGIVRRQPCIHFKDRISGEVMFQEFYVSISDLQKVLAPDVNLLSNRWLFQHLSQSLDARVLSALENAGFKHMPGGYSMNLNVASVKTPAFDKLERVVRGRATLYCEFQLVDIVNDLDGFFAAQKNLHAKGHKTILDGMSALTLQFIDAENYGCDFVKLTWSPDLAEPVITEHMCQALGPLGFDRVILSRCDTEQAIAWGMTQGITRFQGRFLDAMVAAVTLRECERSQACTLAQCNQRHSVISGRKRGECDELYMLDSFPALKSRRKEGME